MGTGLNVTVKDGEEARVYKA